MPLFDPSAFAAIKAEDVESVAQIKADLVAFYQPANSEELFAIERMALARHSLLRAYVIESGLIDVGLEEALDSPGSPQVLCNPELTDGQKATRGQNHSFWIAAGFHRLCRNSDWQMFLRYQAQAERLYRRALEEFERVRALRGTPGQTIDPEPEPESRRPAAPVRHSGPKRPVPAKPAAAIPNRVRPIARAPTGSPPSPA